MQTTIITQKRQLLLLFRFLVFPDGVDGDTAFMPSVGWSATSSVSCFPRCICFCFIPVPLCIAAQGKGASAAMSPKATSIGITQQVARSVALVVMRCHRFGLVNRAAR